MKILRVMFAAICGLAFMVSGCGKKESSADSAAGFAAATKGDSSDAGRTAGAPTAASGRAIEITGNDQ